MNISMEEHGCGRGPAEAQPNRDTPAVLHRPAGLSGAEVRDVPKGMCASPSKDAMKVLPTHGRHTAGYFYLFSHMPRMEASCRGPSLVQPATEQ